MVAAGVKVGFGFVAVFVCGGSVVSACVYQREASQLGDGVRPAPSQSAQVQLHMLIEHQGLS